MTLLLPTKTFFEQYGILHCTVNDTATRDQTVADLGACIVFGWRQIICLGVDLRFLMEEVIADILFQKSILVR